MLHFPAASTQYLEGLSSPRLPPWLRRPGVASELRQAPLLTSLALCSALGDRGDVYSLRVGLVFIYLSITVFTFVLAPTVRSLLPPTGLTLACDPHSLGALPLLQEALLVGRPRKDLLSGTCPWAEVALSGYDP